MAPLASDWYPYPFADVHALGYLRVLINAVWIGLLFVGIAAGMAWIDKILPQLSPGSRPHVGA
ncbi:hypothetical protein ACWCW7_22535 [Nocardia tengchongensis]